jgi:hypothetical protein
MTFAGRVPPSLVILGWRRTSSLLGHASAAEGVTAVYARSRYEREHREALQRLADEIDCIVGVGEKVVQLAALRKA